MFFSGLARGTSIPSFSSSGYSPDLAMLSVPVLLLFRNDIIAFLISSCVKGVNISFGGTCFIGVVSS